MARNPKDMVRSWTRLLVNFIAEKYRRLNLGRRQQWQFSTDTRNFYLQFKVRRKAASSQLTQGCDQLTEGCDQQTERCDQLTEEGVISWLMARFS